MCSLTGCRLAMKYGKHRAAAPAGRGSPAVAGCCCCVRCGCGGVVLTVSGAVAVAAAATVVASRGLDLVATTLPEVLYLDPTRRCDERAICHDYEPGRRCCSRLA